MFKGTIAVKQRLGSSRARRGFTLIEILIVITIVTILATLLLRTIGMARGRANVAREQNDVSQIGMALEAFRQRFGIYPPSRIRLRENTAYSNNPSDPSYKIDQHSVQYLKRIWPNLQLPTPTTPVLWVADGSWKDSSGTYQSKDLTAPATWKNGYDLEGDECLVFFLGGIAQFDRQAVDRSDPNSRIVLHGFAKNSANPGGIPDANNPASMSRDGPFLEFDLSRIYVRKGDQIGPPAPDLPPNVFPDFSITAAREDNKLPSYRSVQTSSSNPAPVVYFSSYEGRGYRPMDCVYPRAMVTNEPEPTTGDDIPWMTRFQIVWPGISQYATSPVQTHPLCPGPNPYTMTRAAPSPNPTGVDPADTDPPDVVGAILKPFAPDTYQVISPGKDGLFGRGGKLPPPGGMTSSDPQYDNIASFTGGSTVGAFSEAQRRTP